ncbi:hypothetical protein Lalb_Chr22g0358431 [Lupinus albus]|uniref:Uncharacterized protein n=1 Tax=Lupinus albus TaxID=3870 RepID=A0A6A4NQ53_LUPAL|nr:hypothetical protein Lalb_Chr22g0358431 [Lupinus albus]
MSILLVAHFSSQQGLLVGPRSVNEVSEEFSYGHCSLWDSTPYITIQHLTSFVLSREQLAALVVRYMGN